MAELDALEKVLFAQIYASPRRDGATAFLIVFGAIGLSLIRAQGVV